MSAFIHSTIQTYIKYTIKLVFSFLKLKTHLTSVTLRFILFLHLLFFFVCVCVCVSTFSRFLFYLNCWNFLILSDNLWPLFPSWTSWSVFSASSCSFKLFLDVVIVQLLSHVWFFLTPWTEAHQSPLASTISCSLLKFMSIESVMPSNQLILCQPLLFMLWILPSIRVFYNESDLHIR